MRRLTALVIVAFLVPAAGRTQEILPSDTSSAGTARTDSTSLLQGVPARVVTASRIDTLQPHFQPSRSPALAMLFSAIVPGAGQAYTASYWKVPVIMGFGVYFASVWLSSNRNYLDYRNRFRADPSDQNLLNQREFYRDQRDTFAWYFLILYVINIADAYVDASLYDFNVGPDLSLRVMPEPNPLGGPSVALRIRF